MIISISGPKGSGKDTVGKIIQALTQKKTSFDGMDKLTEEELEYKVWAVPKYKIVKFADRLKDMVCILLDCVREDLEREEFKSQVLGKEWWVWVDKENPSRIFSFTGQNMNKRFWYLRKTTVRDLLQLLGTECGREILHPNIWVNTTMSNYDILNSKWIITDTRFPNELEAVKKKGGLTIRLERNKEQGENLHISETALDNHEFDYTIVNDGTLLDLVEEVKEILIIEKLI